MGGNSADRGDAVRCRQGGRIGRGWVAAEGRCVSGLLTVVVFVTMSCTAVGDHPEPPDPSRREPPGTARFEGTELPSGVGLTVQNPNDVPRVQEPVTLGVPVARAAELRDPRELRLLDPAGHPVPAQFRVLSRWGPLADPTALVRWVLVDFQADVPARGAAVYTLQQSPGGVTSAALAVTDSPTQLVLDTGALVVRIPKTAAGYLFETTGPDGRLYRTTGLRVLKGAQVFESARAPQTVVLEDTGPLRTVVRIAGTFQAADGTVFVGGDGRAAPDATGKPLAQAKPLQYTVWLTAYSGKATLKVRTRLENNGDASWTGAYWPSNDVFFDAVSLDTVLPPGPYRAVTPLHDLAIGTGPFVLRQTHTLVSDTDERQNFRYQLALNGAVQASGERFADWLGLTAGASGGLTVAVHRFWQNYPKSLELQTGGRLALGLWPADGGPPEVGAYGQGRYFFAGTWHKTYDALFFYHPGDPRAAGAEGATAALLAPLVALPPPAYLAATQAWSPLVPSGATSSVPELQEAFTRYEQYQRILIDPAASADGRTLAQMREQRGAGAQARTDWYGWEDFGDLMHGGNPGHPSNLIYDWPYILWLQYLRSGDPRFRQAAQELTDHSRDLDQHHNEDAQGQGLARNAHDGIWAWETGRSRGHHMNFNVAGNILSHTWNGGYALGYLLTGDSTYLEAATRSANAARRYWEAKHIASQPVVQDQTRSQGWSILLLTNLYKIDGDPAHLALALEIFTHSLLYTECLPPPQGSACGGFIPLTNVYTKGPDRGKVIGTFATYHLEPLAEFHWEATHAGLPTAPVEQFLVRALDWLKDFAYVGGVRNGALYSALTLSYRTDPLNPTNNPGGSIGYNTMVAGAMGYGALLLADRDPARSAAYLAFARQLFRDQLFYREVRSPTRTRFFLPNTRSKIWWSFWPATAPKELGWIGRGGQFYLLAEVLAGQNRGTLDRQQNNRPRPSEASESPRLVLPVGIVASPAASSPGNDEGGP